MIEEREDNPFAACYIRPGYLRYQWPEGESLDTMLGRLAAQRWWGEIIGPHGSGKSSLLAALEPALRQAGRDVQRFTLVAGQHKRPCAGITRWSAHSQVIVDGWEQLSAWARWQVRWRCRRRGAGLLITAHRSFGFPRLATTAATLERALAIVAALEAGRSLRPLTAAEVAEQFRRHNGNLREMLFGLYDLFEARRRKDEPV